MYAVIKTGGKQYRVAPNDVLRVERLVADTGRRIAFHQVLAVDAGDGLRIGTPQVAGAMVTATVLEQTHAPTILVFKKKRRHNYRRKNGHRQELTVIRIGEILTEGRQPSAEPETAPAPREAKAKAWPAKAAKPAKPTREAEAKGKGRAEAKPKKPAAKAKATPAAKKAPAKKAPAKKTGKKKE